MDFPPGVELVAPSYFSFFCIRPKIEVGKHMGWMGREEPHSVASIPARGSNQRETRRGVSLLINDSEWFESLSQHGTWSNRISRSLLFHLLHISVANSHWMEWNINWPKRFSITMMGKGEGRRFLTRVFIHIIRVYLFVFILFATWRQMCLFVFFQIRLWISQYVSVDGAHGGGQDDDQHVHWQPTSTSIR